MNMGALLAYSIAASVFIILLYPVLRMVVNRCTDFSLNRKLLLGGIALSMLLPFLTKVFELPGKSYLQSSTVGNLSQSLVHTLSGNPEDSAPVWAVWIAVAALIYSGGCLLFLLREVYSFARLIYLIKKGEKVNKGYYTLCLLEDTAVAPFSWGRYIFLNSEDDRQGLEEILRHEQSHILHCHWIDVIVADSFCIMLWYNPFAWKTRRLVKLNHEFQADSNVIESGIDPYVYQRLILERAMDRPSFVMANGFGSNSKAFRKRILTIGRHSSSRKPALLALYAIPAIIIGITLISFPATASFLKGMEGFSLISSAPKEINVKPKAVASETINRPAEFEGGEEALYAFLIKNMRYPDVPKEMEKKKHKVVVNFTVAANGSVVDINVTKSAGEAYDREAMRVVGLTSGRWMPALNEGKPVASIFTLPFYFSVMTE